MGLFDKKYCDICTNKIGFFGNRKLADGNMCKDCAALLSPNLVGRKEFTVADIKEHLAYREENKKILESFNETTCLGSKTKLRIDDEKGLWLVSSSPKYKNENTDVLSFKQVTGCTVTIDEEKHEMLQYEEDGKEKSYDPPRFEYDYEFFVHINVNSPWFTEVNFKVNNTTIEGKDSPEYTYAENEANEIRSALLQLHSTVRQAAEAGPKSSVMCPHCHASTIPDASGRCEYCGGAVR